MLKANRTTSSYNISLFLEGIVWLILSLLIMLIPKPSDLTIKFLSVETVVFFILIMLNMCKAKKGVFHISIFFVLMLFLFLQGQVLLNAFNITIDGLLSNKFSNTDLTNGILQIHIFIAIFIIAVALNRKGCERAMCGNHEKLIGEDRTALKVGYIISLCSIPFELYVSITKLNLALTSGYASLYQEVALNSIPSSAKILSYFFMPGCFYIFFSSQSGSFHEKLAVVLLSTHMTIQLLTGYRSLGIIPMLLIIYGLSEKSKFLHAKSNKKMKKRIRLLCVLTLLIVILVFPVVRATRNSGGITNLTLDEVFSVENNEIFSTINDMGKSMQTVIYTQQLVPAVYPFRYGVSYLVNLTEAIPNLFWARHPAEVYGSLGRWITKIVDPSFYEFGGALGYSCVAEAYINFSWIGVIVFAFLLGTIITNVENRVENSSYAVSYASWVIVANYLLMYPRGELSTIVRGFFWYMLIPLAFTKLIRGNSRKNVYRSFTNQKPLTGFSEFSE